MKKSEMLAKRLEKIKAKVEEMFTAMLESASDEDVKKYENYLKILKGIQEEYDAAVLEELEEEARNERGGRNNTPPIINENSGRGRTLSEEAQTFINNLREAMAKGTAFAGALPIEVSSQIIMKKESFGIVRKYCDVRPATGDYVIYIEGDEATVSYTGEGEAITESTPSLGTLKLGALKLTCLVKISSEYIADVAVDVLDYLSTVIGKAFAKKEDTEILFGKNSTDASKAIRGVDGKIATTNTVTAASATAITWEEIKTTIGKIKEYRHGAVIFMAQTTIDFIHSFKDGSTYMFPQNEEVKALLGVPVIPIHCMPSIAAGKTVMIIGDFSCYHLVDRKGMTIRVLNELYANTDQVGAIAIERIDGDCQPEAFAKLVMKAA